MTPADPSSPLANPALPTDPTALAAYIAGKLCHDFISPAGAIMSGLDLLDDPTAQDMRDDALGLIKQSAKKMVAHVHFARVAFGSANSSEGFSSTQLRDTISQLHEGGRANLDWRIDDDLSFSKREARILVNLAWMTLGALAMGGEATITARKEAGQCIIVGSAEGARARLKPEALIGLRGQPLIEGLPGQWIQPYWLWLSVSEAKGELKLAVDEGRVGLLARIPV